MRNIPLIVIGLITIVLPSTFLYLSVNLLFFVPLLVGLACVFAGWVRMSEAARRCAIVIGAILCLTATVIPLALMAHGNRPGKPILLILPDGYSGEFRIVKDSQHGQDLVEQDGRFIFEIPQDGTLFVKNDSPFYRWHSEGARYKSGQVVSYEDLGTTAGNRVTGLNRSEGSTDFDGTTHSWRIMGSVKGN